VRTTSARPRHYKRIKQRINGADPFGSAPVA